MKKEIDNSQKGIQFEATFGQFFSAIILVLVLFVLPISGYEIAKDKFVKEKEVYTAASLRGNDVSVEGVQEGRVAGVSTSRNGENITDQVGTIFQSRYLLIGAGIVLVLISTSLSVGLVYDFVKK
ncbi:hypothetical protein JW978_03500 [Candidatus Dojkabacteria bacterium]|nr:hypothetical protein [Candidatus Dojkabacteria bacterium]